jgi:hypothetical protein
MALFTCSSVSYFHPAYWTKTFLANVAIDEPYKLYTLKASDELVLQIAEKLMAVELGVWSGFLPKIIESTEKDFHRQ